MPCSNRDYKAQVGFSATKPEHIQVRMKDRWPGHFAGGMSEVASLPFGNVGMIQVTVSARCLFAVVLFSI
jgi:hypothetical protein